MVVKNHKIKCEICVIDDSLVAEFYFQHNQYLTWVPLMTIEENESELNSGRFEHYTDEQQQHVIQYMKCSTIESVTNQVEWIKQNVRNKWSLIVDWESGNKLYAIFSFENLDEALLFKLSN